MKRFASSQLKNNLVLIAQLIATVLHFVWCYLFIKVYDLKIEGAAFALNLTYIINWVSLEVLIRSSESFNETYIPLSW